VQDFDDKGRPVRTPGILPTEQGTLVYPGNQGATNWYNPSYSPETGLFYIPTWENTSSVYRKASAPPEFVDRQIFEGLTPLRQVQPNDDVFGSVVAWDPRSLSRKWTFKLSAASPEGGILTTAGNLLFAGGRDGQFVALDSRSGKRVWETNLGPSVAAAPITYLVGGKQFVSVQCGNALYTFAVR